MSYSNFFLNSNASQWLSKARQPWPQDIRRQNPASELRHSSPPQMHQASRIGKSDKSDKTEVPGELSPMVKAFLLKVQELGFDIAPLIGTEGDDFVNAWENSVVQGREGNDVISVWSNSYVSGGKGNDVIAAWSGSHVTGGAGDDSIDIWSDSSASGGDGNDIITAWSNTRVHGGEGNDIIDIWSDSFVDGGNGDDIIKAWADTRVLGGNGNDVISAWSNTQVFGGSGNDIITAWSNSYVDGGDGDDVISAHVGSLVRGGRGNDYIEISDDTKIQFNKGDGKDIVAGFFRNATIELGAGLSKQNTHISKDEQGQTVISFGDGSDSITVDLLMAESLTLSYADGSTHVIQPNSKPMNLAEAKTHFAELTRPQATTTTDMPTAPAEEATEPAPRVSPDVASKVAAYTKAQA